jgi:excisionase family DNA binding protein
MHPQPATKDTEAVRERLLGGTTDIDTIAKALGCSVRKIERLIGAGMPMIKIGATRRFNLDNCREWLLSQERGRPEPPRRPGRPRRAA